MVPWGLLLACCLTSIAVSLALRIFAGPLESPADLGAGIRASYLPVVAGLAFLLHDPQRQLTGVLPARAWLPTAIRVAMALPVLTLSATTQLQIAARALSADLHAAGQHAVAGLPWIALTAESAAWCTLALALAAGFERTRWHDLAGFLAAIVALGVVGALAMLPLHLMPTAITAMTGAQQRQWAAAWRLWAAAGTAGILTTGWAAGDSWRRVRVWWRPSAGRGRAAPA